jgi:hypothetical protein
MKQLTTASFQSPANSSFVTILAFRQYIACDLRKCVKQKEEEEEEDVTERRTETDVKIHEYIF